MFAVSTALRHSTGILRRCLSVVPARCNVYEPEYLNVKPEIPELRQVNVRLRGYDFVVVERFAKYVHRLAVRLRLEKDTYAVPARSMKVVVYTAGTTQAEKEYSLRVYERVVRLGDLRVTHAPVLFEMIRQHLPIGVQLSVRPIDKDEEEFRFVPELELRELQKQLGVLRGGNAESE